MSGDGIVYWKKLKGIICLVVIVLTLVSCTASALAAPHLEWCTTAVYYDGGHLIIKGYFYNSGTRIIDHVNWLNLKVYFRQYDSDWWQAAGGSWYDFNVYLYPGDSSYYTLRIINPPYYPFNYWKVDGSVNYHYTD
jgi:hypothetical protein